MLSYKKKNYALLAYDGTITIRGSSLTSRSMERFCRNFLRQVFEAMLHENIFLIHELYRNLVHDIITHRLNADDFAKIETLNDSLERYMKEVETGKRNRSALYEAALSSGLSYRVGDKIAYYITGDNANVKAFEHAKLVSNWDQNFPDENVGYYLKRLDEVTSKFEIFFTPEDFQKVFSTDAIAKEYFSDIKIVTILVESHFVAEESESPETVGFEPTIWLDS
jgi:DNA polymerase elongation subunit (family B)